MLLVIPATGYYIYNDYNKILADRAQQQSIMRNVDATILKALPPSSTIRKSIVNPNDQTKLKLTLYQYQTCPFCCKLRAFLDYHGFSYDIVEVNSITRRQTKWTDYKKVPFLLCEISDPDSDETTVYQLKDSSVIISILASIVRNPDDSLAEIVDSNPGQIDEEGKLCYANKFFVMYGNIHDHFGKDAQKEVVWERKWRKWVDATFVHMLSPNVYRTPTESLNAFKWFSEVGDWERLFPAWERLLVVYAGAAVMYFIGRRLKKRHHLEEDVRQSLYNEANKWTTEIRKRKQGPFMGGETPNLGDLSMYGVLTAIEGCEAFQDMMQNTKISPWFHLMQKQVKGKAGEALLVKRGEVE